MHIPDNYLSPQTCAVMTAVMIPAWTISVKKIRAQIPGEKLPLLGVAAAFSFLGMMFNIPLPGGTTGHAVGGTLTALLVGPYGACISISVALLLQALLFGDGGILAFGANCFNMAFVMPFAGYAVYRLIAAGTAKKAGSTFGKKTADGMLTGAELSDETSSGRKMCGKKSAGRQLAGAVIGSYVGINAAALAAAIEFGIQPMLFRDASGSARYCPYPLSVSIPAMMIGHLTIFGLAEAVYTAAVFLFLQKTAPETLRGADAYRVSWPAGKTQQATGAGAGLDGRTNARRSGQETDGSPEGHRSLGIPVLLGILMIGTPLGLLAEGTAWGEWGADEIAATGAGYIPSGMQNGFSFETLLPDYSFGNAPAAVGYLLSAVIGVAVLLMVFRLLSGLAGGKQGRG